MPTARGYVRVSTEEQAVNGVSIDAQKEILQAYAVVKGYTDFKIYTDEGFSGKNLNRPDVQRLLEECRSGKVEAVIVWRLDRLSRSLRDTLETIEDIFMPAGVSLISVTENIDTSTPTGKLMLTMIGAINEFERMNLLERQREGIALAVHEGKYKGRKEVQIEDFNSHYERYMRREVNKAQLAKELNISRPTLDKLIREHEKTLGA